MDGTQMNRCHKQLKREGHIKNMLLCQFSRVRQLHGTGEVVKGKRETTV